MVNHQRCSFSFLQYYTGADPGGGGGAPLKFEKIWFFGVESWFFTRNTPTNFAPPSARRKFFFKCAPPNLKSWIRPCYNAPCDLHKRMQGLGMMACKWLLLAFSFIFLLSTPFPHFLYSATWGLLDGSNSVCHFRPGCIVTSTKIHDRSN